MRQPSSKLRFIKRIHADGTSRDVTDVENEKLQSVNRWYKITPLSITHGTYIASDFATYVVEMIEPHNVEAIQDCWDDINQVLIKHNAKLYVDESKHADKKLQISL